MTTLPLQEWQERREAYRERVQVFTGPTRARLARGESHPVDDFLLRYYRFSLGHLEEWHAGWDTALEQPGNEIKAPRGKFYRGENNFLFLDPALLLEKERRRLQWTADLLRGVAERPGQFHCHGLHEWAMVYRGGDIRHRESAPLRLPQEEIDSLVESRPICCTHFDAFRFFAPAAQPLNRHQPTLWTREENEQPGCIHTNMDLYKWAYKSMPWIGSDLLWECFLFARSARKIDMRASPYDLREWGFEPIRIETAEGRREYEAEQRALAEAARPLRTQLIESLDKVLKIAHSEGSLTATT